MPKSNHIIKKKLIVINSNHGGEGRKPTTAAQELSSYLLEVMPYQRHKTPVIIFGKFRRNDNKNLVDQLSTVSSPPVATFSLMTRCLLMHPALLFWPNSNSPTFPRHSHHPSHQNLHVKTNMWQYAIIGTNWMTLYIQICCLLPISWHINSLSSEHSALSDIGANELFAAVCRRQKKSGEQAKKKPRLCFCFATIRESSLIRPI